ncbi:MAG: acyl--CoA ligase [Candidatus Marinimicrobia bacterium]|nr:acyl--CoA ligase [Candidatus Neomarinimicrobiota bacterium]
MKNIFEYLDFYSKYNPNKTFISYHENNYSYKQINNAVNNLCNIINRSFANYPKRIALFLPGSPEFITSYFASIKLGADVVIIPPNITYQELSNLLKQTKPDILILNNNSNDKVDKAKFLSKCEFIKIIFSSNKDNSLNINELINYESEFKQTTYPNFEERQILFFLKKFRQKRSRIGYSYKNITSAARSLAGIVKFLPKKVFINSYPLHTTKGNIQILNTCLASGGRLVISNNNIPNQIAKQIQKQKVTIFVTDTNYLIETVENFENIERKSKQKVILLNGILYDRKIFKEIEEKFNFTILEGFGLPETSEVCCWNLNKLERVELSIGKPLPCNQVLIVNEDGKEMPPYKPGYLAIKGENICNQIIDDQTKIYKDWIKTELIGYKDHDDFIYLKSKKKNILHRHGYEVYIEDIEDFIRQLEEVNDVAISVTESGGGHDKYKACIKLKNGIKSDTETLKKVIIDHLPKYLIPDELEVVKSIPKDEYGNILRHKLNK